jgi:hypothetical protein
MIAINIGRTFLNAYNEKYNKTLSAKEFFINEFWELFYNHKKYMMWITNSAFNPGNHLGDISDEGRKLKLENLIDSISQIKLDEKNVIGYSVVDLTGTTSGQITNMNLPIGEEEAYLSWIGAGFGIEVGAVAMLIDDKQLLLDIFEGWKLYRKLLNDIPQIEKGNQIERWNSQWLAHRYNKRKYNPNNPSASFDPTETKENKMAIASLPWICIIEALARNYPDTLITSYIYKLGFNTPNTTIGFIILLLPKIKYTFDLYIKYFGTTDKEQINNLFGTKLGFATACQLGAIGVNALEPKGFTDFINNGTIPNFNPNDEEKVINFYTYQIWLLSMLNNEELWDKSREFAQQLINYVAGSEKARANRKTAVEELLKSTKKEKFLENLIQIMKEPDSEKCEEIGKEVHFMSGTTEFPYFATLLRFQYASLNKLKQ